MTIAPTDLPAVACIVAGVFFFVAGTVGLLRFPDPHSRLHALTKADNLGLGLLAVGVGLHLGSGWAAAKLAVIWALAVFAASTAAQLLARSALRAGERRRPAQAGRPGSGHAAPEQVSPRQAPRERDGQVQEPPA